MVRRFLLLFIITWISSLIYAQGFRLEIKQVFPKNILICSRDFNYPDDLDKEKTKQKASLQGNANYVINVRRPQKPSTSESVQNINWIQIVNGAETYHKKETKPERSYPKAIIWEGFKCNLYGKQVGTKKRREFIYRVVFNNSPNAFETDFIEKDSAKAQANHIYKKVYAKDHLVEVLVYKFTDKDTIAIDTLSNMTEYQAFLDKENTNALLMTEANKHQAIQAKINTFKERTLSLGDSVGQLKSAMENCITLLSDAQTQLSDSLFFAEHMDSLYRDVLFNRIIPCATKKEKKRIQEHVDDFRNDEHVELIKILIFYTRKIEEKL